MEDLPGGEIIAQGLEDLERGVESPQALLVSMAATRLRDLGLTLPDAIPSSPEVKLYRLLTVEHGAGAHSKYNAWRRRLASFLRTARCAGW
jgi:hypothetical protein